VNTVVVPVAGQSAPTDVSVMPGPDNDEALPRLARGLTREWGRSHAHLAAGSDAVVVLRSYLGEFGAGMAEAVQAPLVVDLDDDDEDFFRQSGDIAEADRYAALVRRLRDFRAAMVSADGFADTVCIPNSVSFPATHDRSRVNPVRALVVGNFTYAPNIDGAKWMLRHVVPVVRKTVPGFEVRLVGPGSDKIDAVGAGFVQDLANEYARAAVVVAPLLTGSGTRTKIIEAWAHEVPVVSTTVGAHGLGSIDGTHLLIADSPEEMGSAISRILTDPETAAVLATEGHRMACERFHPDVVAAQVHALIGAVASGRRRVLEATTNLDVTETDDGLVVFDKSSEVVHHLNTTAAVIFMLADGSMNLDEIVSEVREVFKLDADSAEIVENAVDNLARAGIVRFRLVD